MTNIDLFNQILKQNEEVLAQNKTILSMLVGTDELVRVPDVAKMIGIDKSNLYAKIRSGVVDSVKIGGSVRLKRSTVDELMRFGGTQEI